MTKEALKLALEALTYIYTETTADEDELIDQAIIALREALAQPEQEPVAIVHIKDDCLVGSHRDNSKPFPDGQYGLWPIGTNPPQQEPVAKYIGECSEGSLVHLYDDVKKGTNFYTTPPKRPWVDMTDEEIQVIAKKARSKDHAVTLTGRLLKEKNT